MNKQPVLIMAGGTGGHIFPGLAVAKELQQRDVPVVWLGSKHSMESKLVPMRDIPFIALAIGGVRGKSILTKLLAPFKLLIAVINALIVIRRVKPQSVLGMGGFASGPGGLAAWISRTPLYVHEQNALPGMTNRYLSKCARNVLEGFAGSFEPMVGSLKARYTGNPVREDIENCGSDVSGKYQDRLNVLVLGGSRGALYINKAMPQVFAQLTVDIAVKHQCGLQHKEITESGYAGHQVNAEVLPFIDDMKAAYTWADLVIARAGALTLTELMHAALPAVLIPYPHAVDDHQTVNAQALVAVDAAVVVQEKELDINTFATLINDLLTDRERLKSMSKNAFSLAQRGSTKAIADICLQANEGVK